jgi:hypothetical protein
MIYQCPKCELRFERETERDYHLRNDHPDFRHEYPATTAPVPPAARPADPPTAQAAAAPEPPVPEPQPRGWFKRLLRR